MFPKISFRILQEFHFKIPPGTLNNKSSEISLRFTLGNSQKMSLATQPKMRFKSSIELLRKFSKQIFSDNTSWNMFGNMAENFYTISSERSSKDPTKRSFKGPSKGFFRNISKNPSERPTEDLPKDSSKKSPSFFYKFLRNTPYFLLKNPS